MTPALSQEDIPPPEDPGFRGVVGNTLADSRADWPRPTTLP